MSLPLSSFFFLFIFHYYITYERQNCWGFYQIFLIDGSGFRKEPGFGKIPEYFFRYLRILRDITHKFPARKGEKFKQKLTEEFKF